MTRLDEVWVHVNDSVRWGLSATWKHDILDTNIQQKYRGTCKNKYQKITIVITEYAKHFYLQINFNYLA